MSRGRVLISGGGVAGYTLAWWLHRFAFDVVVVERMEENQRTGYGIEFVGTGWDVADRMGLIPELERQRIVVRDTLVKGGDGRSLGQFDLSVLYGAAAGKAIPLDRSELVRVLYEALPGAVEVRFSVFVDHLEESDDGVDVQFVGGERERFDLVIGADGYRSQVRRLVFGPQERFDRFLGYYTGAFYLPNDGRFGEHSVMVLQPDLMATVLARDVERLLVNVSYKEPDRRRVRVVHRRAEIAAHAQGGDWFVRELLGRVPADAPIFLDSMAQIEVPTWSKGRVALVGDAAYCMSALSGQGTSMAMAGAWALAHELAERPSHTAAFEAYEATLRPHIEDTQRKARGVAASFVPSSRLRIAGFTALLRLVSVPWVARLASGQFNSESLFDTGLLLDREPPGYSPTS